MNDDNILESRVRDLYALCEKRGISVFSGFYDGGEQAVLEDSKIVLEKAVFFGGNPLCERKILGVFPDWQEPDSSEFPISLIKITCSFKKDFTHRDYLGSLMGLGIQRDRIGDIAIDNEAGYVFVHESVSEYIMSNLSKIGSSGVKLSFIDPGDFVYPQPKYAHVSVVSPSLRIDAVVAAVLNISRAKAAALINHEKVSINHRPALSTASQIKENDLISVRGFGRFVFEKITGETRSQRLHLTIKKYL